MSVITRSILTPSFEISDRGLQESNCSLLALIDQDLHERDPRGIIDADMNELPTDTVADRDVHIDQAKAMGSALSGAQIRMYGGGDGTMDTIRGLFTQGFGIGEILEGLAQSLLEGLRQRFNANGIRGLLGRLSGDMNN